MKMCQNIVRAFDDTERRVMGRIEIPLLIGQNTYEVEFLVMDIKPSYNCLLGRPWIHSAEAVPSSLHQKLKLVTDGRLVTINAKEDIIASVTSDAPYIGAIEEAIKCSFRSLEFVNATFIVEGNKIPVPKIPPRESQGTNADGQTTLKMIEIVTYDDRNCNISPNLLKMVEQEEKQILPHKELVEIMDLGDGQKKKEVKIGACIIAETKRDLIELLQEFKDVFVWSYQDMSRLSRGNYWDSYQRKGDQIDPDKVKAIQELPPPHTQNEV
ncbi:aldehyde dehydrogenase family 2 member C4-like [Gossypium australe]|uniref:Aldehyde dehydrogenase family 2 member C4-like n=1 Tax=Gossypium australe TaxID=47621 RepID=A0A5B6VCX7_9ROSI|nr:aldehyde dehydrogenase family 2 member C4-like [Gossypium australe]